MAIIATSNGGTSYEPIPSGSYPARCYSMIHLGTIEENILGTVKKLNKVRITWELPTELKVFKEENGEQPHVISKEFTLSLHEKATLRNFLKNWRGKDFTEDEAKAFDIEKKRIANRVDKLNKKIAERKPIIPKITDKILKEYEEIESSRKININVEDLRGILKKLLTDTIKKNTGKFPIMTPQEINKIGDIIDKVKSILIKKDNSDISNSDIVDYIKEHTLDINKMIDEKYFN